MRIDKVEVKFKMNSTVTEMNDFDKYEPTQIDAFADLTMRDLVFGALSPLVPENENLKYGEVFE